MIHICIPSAQQKAWHQQDGQDIANLKYAGET